MPKSALELLLDNHDKTHAVPPQMADDFGVRGTMDVMSRPEVLGDGLNPRPVPLREPARMRPPPEPPIAMAAPVPAGVPGMPLPPGVPLPPVSIGMRPAPQMPVEIVAPTGSVGGLHKRLDDQGAPIPGEFDAYTTTTGYRRRPAMAGEVPEIVQRDAQDVANLGLPEQVRTVYDPRSGASIAMLDPEGRFGKPRPELPQGSMDNLDRVVQESPMARSLVNSGVIRATDAEKSTLRSMRAGTFDGGTANTRDRQAQERERAVAQARTDADLAAGRQIAVAQQSPQGVAGAAGQSVWNPVTRQWESHIRTEKDTTSLTSASDKDLLHMHQQFGPRVSDENDPNFKIAMIGAKTPAQREAVRKEFTSPGDPEMLALVKQELKRRGMLKDEPAGAAAPAAPADGKKRTIGGIAPL